MSTDTKTEECPICRQRRETYSAIGLAVFSISLLSCGLLMPLSIVVAIVIQSLIAVGCRDCRRKRVGSLSIVRWFKKK